MMMVMEFVVELFFTASLSLCLAYVIVHLVSMASSFSEATIKDEVAEKEAEQEEEEEEKDCSCSGLDDDNKDVILVKDEEELTESVDKLENQVEAEEQSLEKAEILLRKEDNSEERSSNFEETDAKGDDLVEIKEIITEKLDQSDHDDQRGEEDDDDDEVKEEGLLDEDDDWEGIEKSEGDKLFSSASKFVGDSENSKLLENLGNEVQMQLYGLHKVAMEGPCREQAPMALMVSARAKWNAWQRLGNMSPEMAMEQYVTLLSGAVPGWVGENHQGDKDIVVSEAGECRTEAHENIVVYHQPDLKIDRKSEELQSLDGNRDTGSL